jgi:hypothetical protein
VRDQEFIEQEQSRSVPLTPVQIAAAVALNSAIKLDEVHDSVRSLFNSKAPGTDGIVSEVLKNGGPKMEECLHVLCGRVFWQGEVPMDWPRGVVVPLHKDGSKKEPLNYRPVTLLSIVGKVYTGIL